MKYSYSNGIFITSFDSKILIKTNEPPFQYKYYFQLFFEYYLPKTGDGCIDAGGFNGHVALLISALVGNQGKVFPFEPDIRNLEKCERNISLNKSENIQLISKGLWSKNTQISFFSDASVASSVFYRSGSCVETTIEVTSIDEFIQSQDIKRLDFIKMNIEGSEIEALKGAMWTLRNLKPKIAVTADHTINGQQTYSFVKGILLDAGYSFNIKRVRKGAIVLLGFSID